MAETIPLFPLQTVLFPEGTLSLQIFEPRYLDMIKRCMREDSGFGVVGIHSGSEVASTFSGEMDLLQVGTYARIVDWDALENGLLGIVARGGEKFSIKSVATQPDLLVIAEVEFLPSEATAELLEEHLHLAELLKQLVAHPSVEPLHSDVDYTSALQISNLLSQLLPVPLPVKFELLHCTEAAQRLMRLNEIVASLSGS